MFKQYDKLPTNLQKYKIVTDFCELWALADKDRLFALSFHNDFLESNAKVKKNDLLEKAEQQIQEYFAGKRKHFSLNTFLVSTNFQKGVLNQLKAVIYGKTISYKDLAKKQKSHARAVGGVMRANPIPIIFPCHRVIGVDGSLTGFGGGLKLKKQMLDLEKEHSNFIE